MIRLMRGVLSGMLGISVLLALGACSEDDPALGSSPGNPAELTVGEQLSSNIAAFGTFYATFTAENTSHTGFLTQLTSDFTWHFHQNTDFSDNGSQCGTLNNGNADEICMLDLSGINGFDLVPGNAYFIRIEEWDSVAGSFAFLVN